MLVLLHENQLTYFRRKCRQSPNEQLAYLVGSSTDKTVTVVSFVYPKLVSSTPCSVEADGNHYLEIEAAADDLGLKVVGSIHSHPGAPPILSQTDYDGHIEDGNIVSGIVEVCRDRRTYVAFWTAHSALPCELQYI